MSVLILNLNVMDQLLSDYQAYYKVRMERYEGQPLRAHSYASEKALYDAIASCQQLEEFKDKIGNLNIKNAIATVKDREKAFLDHYQSLQETVRAKEAEMTLARIDAAASDMDVVEIASKASQEALVLITLDLFTDHFYTDIIPRLETIDVLRNMDAPEKYAADIQKSIQTEKADIKEGVAKLEEDAQSWKSGWKFNPDLIWEHRHRKKIPLPNEVLKQRLNEYKNL